MKEIRTTAKQSEAWTMINSQAQAILLHGGARSGKSFIYCAAIADRAQKYPGSRHLIARYRLEHARTSIWRETMLPIIRGKAGWRIQDRLAQHENGSEIWLGGFDDQERIEKILGHEYCIDPDSLVLTSDLRWVFAHSLKVGQELIGFPENLDDHQTLCPSFVKHISTVKARRLKVITDRGSTIISENHRFVVYGDDRRHRNFRSLSWREAKLLKVGDNIRFASKPWNVGLDKDTGWAAGILDGEGRRGFNTKNGGGHFAAVLLVEELGESDVISISTSSKTLIADGFLGHNCDIYCNEVSQISYEAVVMARSRLAQKIDGCTNKLFCDCNPPSPNHWSHKMFFEKIEPRDRKPLVRPGLYAQLQMNPGDNLSNLPDGYISDVLMQLPDAERRRFLHGEWLKPERTVFYNFGDSMIFEPEKEPPLKDFEEFTRGIDFGLNPAAVLIGWMGDSVWLLDDWGAYNITAGAMNAELDRRWAKYQPHSASYCDPSGGERIQEITAGEKADNSVEDGINYLNTKMEHGYFHVSRKCAGWLGEVFDYKRDEKGRVVKMNDHYMDASRYGIYSRAGTGISIYV